MRRLLLGVLVICSLGAASAVSAAAQRTGGAAAGSQPTLGVANSHASGFGKVRPRVVSYEGDGQSLVAQVKWRSWGGTRAVGRGHASWVWPGWCSACGSVNLPATVVAFGLSKCGGKRIYKYVEWYFPSRGMKFERSLAEVNLCTWSFHTGGLFKPRRCAAVNLAASPGSRHGLAGTIRVYDPRLSCVGVRRFLKVSQVMHRYARNARFHHDGWWCGSELSMQVTKLPPQNFSCERGDYEDISFNVRPH